MKILLVSVNASYMHTNLAIRDLKNYADSYFASRGGVLLSADTECSIKPQIEIAESYYTAWKYS